MEVLVVGTHKETDMITKGRAMDFALTAADLRGIADAVDKLNDSGVRVEAATVDSHRITLEWHGPKDQRDRPWYTVTAIERAEAPR